jgi:uncharacterized protein (DUF1697 family)
VTTYVALLRGINLGARNRIAMPELRELIAALGAEDVTTYVQSGNAVFTSAETAVRLGPELERRIEQDLGVSVRVLLRSRSQLAKVVAGNPFGARDPSALHVTFLAGAPERAKVRVLDPERGAPDEFRCLRQEVYLRCPNGYGRTKLTNAYFEKQLGLAATTRNWKTVTALADLAAELS